MEQEDFPPNERAQLLKLGTGFAPVHAAVQTDLSVEQVLLPLSPPPGRHHVVVVRPLSRAPPRGLVPFNS